MDPSAAADPPPIAFRCGACGLTLSVPASMAGTSGPCPSCQAWISSPAPPEPAEPSEPVSAFPVKRQSAAREPRRKGRIPADSIVDQTHLAQRESAKTIKVLALFVVAFCACLAVIWFMKDWMGK